MSSAATSRWCALLAAVWLAASDYVAAQQPVPPLTGHVVDTTGAPTRRYLTEPPVEYRAPDPNAPLTPAEEESKGFSFRRMFGLTR